MKIFPDDGHNWTRDADIVRTSSMVTLIGGGRVNAPGLEAALSRAPVLVAADGGADAALALGRRPRAVIGDMDSLGDARSALPQEALIPVFEQDTTDFEKAVRRIDAPGILAVGFSGRRLDHELAVLNTLVRPGAPPCIVLGETDIVFSAPRDAVLDLDLPAGSRLSLFPMGPVAGTSDGLAWPIDGLAFAPDGAIGTSNRVTRGQVRLWFDRPGMLVIVPLAALDAALTTLAPR